MFGIRKKMRQGAAYEVKQMILVQKARYTMIQNEKDGKDIDAFTKYQDKITALSDLQEKIEEEFKLIN
jgi:hypothetical protein